MTPEEPSLEPIPAEIIEHGRQATTRLGGAFTWSRLVAAMATEHAGGSETGGNAPNPWTSDPEEAA